MNKKENIEQIEKIEDRIDLEELVEVQFDPKCLVDCAVWAGYRSKSNGCRITHTAFVTGAF